MKRLQNDQRGLAHIAMILLAVIVLAAIGGTGYYVMNKQKKADGKTSTSETAAAVVADAATVDECNALLKDKEFCKFAGSWKGPKSYKAVFTSTTKEGTTVMTMEIENDRRSKIVSTTEGKEVMAFVTLDDASYIKDLADGKWTKYVQNSPKPDTAKDDVKIDFKDDPSTATNESLTQYKKIGKEACGKQTCWKYQIVDPSTPKDEQYLWFDTADYLLRKYSVKNDEGTSMMELSYGKITISAPSPVKDAPNYEGMSQAELQAQIDAATLQSDEE